MGDSFNTLWTASYRSVFDMDNDLYGYWLLDGGVSADPFSPHYDD
jgi:hypothetical protein